MLKMDHGINSSKECNESQLEFIHLVLVSVIYCCITCANYLKLKTYPLGPRLDAGPKIEERKRKREER